MPYPCIAACGYRKIQSPKTSLKFPAWLIQFDDTKTYWRSKKDFLLLFRASKSFLQAPKANLSNLANQSPWRRPGNVARRISGEEVTDNYHVAMKRSILQLDRYLQSVADSDDLSKAWTLFSRTRDTEGIVGLCSTTVGAIKSSKLGQYFCSEETAKQVVKVTLDFVMGLGSDNEAITLLEPSCGHGDILWELLEEIEARSIDLASIRIVACDLDASAIETCKKHGRKDQVHEWREGDFLEIKPHKRSTVVVLGGPPYTSGPGSGESMVRDLPDAFFKHATEVWMASFVAFILPQRYRDNPMHVPNSREWTIETQELEESTFYFQGRDRVFQPSIIQSYKKNAL